METTELSTEQRIIKLAKMMYEMMERRTRNSGEQFYCLADNAPEWMRDVCFAAHNDGEYLPDDAVYEELNSTLSDICDMDEDSDEDDMRDILLECEPNCYISNLTHWLASDCRYVGYIDVAFDQGLLADKPTGSDILMAAQKLWLDEIRNNTFSKLLELAEDEEFVTTALD